ncbi:MAG: phosphotransferase [Desulfobacteraceae bacterium]|nr:phosphotransferase [Desulfobacteraceae bacterium]
MEKQLIPIGIEDITSQWLTGALTESGVLKENAVKSVERNIIGEGQGYVGILARLSIEYEQPDQSLPQTMIAKIPTRETKSRMITEAFWNYERENRLYEEILPQLSMRTPHCFYSNFDRGKGEKWMNKVYGRYRSLPKSLVGLYFIYAGLRNLRMKRRYILLLEDFGDLEQISHLEGCTIEDAKMVMKPLGIAHAELWESPLLNKFWLKDHGDFSNMIAFLSNRWQPIIKKTHPGKISPKMQAFFDWLNKNNKKLDEYTKTRPHTLIHTDYRLDNIFFDREKGEIAVIDWQATCPGLGLFDIAFFILNNCDTPLNQEQTEELVTIYHQGLVEGGLSNYSLDECMSDYPYGLLLAMRYWLIIFGGIEVEKDPNAIKLLGVILDRIKPMLEAIDLDSLAF